MKTLFKWAILCSFALGLNAFAEQRQNVLPPPGTQAVPTQFMLHCSRDSAGMFHFLEHQYGEVIRAVLTKHSIT